MFKLAKSLSPDTLLFLNDYGIIMDRLEQLWEPLWEPLCSISIPQKWSVCTFPTANKRSSGPGCPD